MKNKKLLYITVGIAVIVAAGVLLKAKVLKTSVSPNDPEKFSGIVTKFKTDCAFDGECSVFVGDQEVVVSGGFMGVSVPVGKSEISSFDGSYLGTKVDVYAKNIGPNRHTLIGDSKYYIY